MRRRLARSAKAPSNIDALNIPAVADCISPVLGNFAAFRFAGFAVSDVIADVLALVEADALALVETFVLADVEADVLADVEALVLALVETLMLADND